MSYLNARTQHPMTEISVNHAIRKGNKNTTFVFAAILHTGLIAICLLYLFDIITLLWAGAFVPLVVFIALYFQSRSLYKWQIWAYKNVKNVNELKVKADKNGLTPTWEKKLFPPTREEQLAWKSIQFKFEQQNITEEDTAIPEIFEIHYSALTNRIQLIMSSLGFLIVCLISYSLLRDDGSPEMFGFIVLGVFGLFALVSMVENIIQLQTTGPVITFSWGGIKIKKVFFDKKDIKQLAITKVGRSKLLTIKFHGTRLTHDINIMDLDIHSEQVEDVADLFEKKWRAELNQE